MAWSRWDSWPWGRAEVRPAVAAMKAMMIDLVENILVMGCWTVLDCLAERNNLGGLW